MFWRTDKALEQLKRLAVAAIYLVNLPIIEGKNLGRGYASIALSKA
jgi:hypothetical protein